MSPQEKQAREAGPPKLFDNTLRTTFHGCQRKYYWWAIRQVDYITKPSYFSFGSAWHEIKGSWYLSHSEADLEPKSPEWTLASMKALSKGLDFWDNSGSLPDKKGNSRENLMALWGKYIQSYPTEPWKLVKGGAELGWLWPLPTKGGRPSGYFLGGSLDGYINWPGFGLMPLEEKTTSIWLSDFYIMQWRFSSQITGYIWYLTNLLGSERVHGALINMATKQIVKGTGTTPQFARTLETRSEDDLLEFESDWRRDIEDIERSWDRWHFPKTTDTINCTGGIGKTACLYRGFCLSGLEPSQLDPSTFPNMTIRSESWEPWKRSAAMLPTGQAIRKAKANELPKLLQNLKTNRLIY